MRLRSPPESSAERRCSFLHTHLRNIGLVTTMTIASAAHLLEDVAQPALLNKEELFSPYTAACPPSDTDLGMLYQCDYRTLDCFLVHHACVKTPGFSEFFSSFSRPPEELQAEGWEGPCSNFVQFFGEWGSRHGHPVYRVTVRPSDITRAVSQPWHVFGIICITPDCDYLIADNNHIQRWHGPLSQYLGERWPQYTDLSVRQWRRTKENIVARFASVRPGNDPIIPTTVSVDPPGPTVAVALAESGE